MIGTPLRRDPRLAGRIPDPGPAVWAR